MQAGERVVHHHLLQRRLQLADAIVRLLGAQERPDPGEQLRGIAGPGDVIVRAELQPADPLRRLAAVRGDEHRDEFELVRLQARQQVEPVHVGERAAEDDEIGAVGGEKIEHLRAAASLDHRHSRFGEQRLLEGALGRLCLHDQDAGRIRHTVPPCSRCVVL